MTSELDGWLASNPAHAALFTQPAGDVCAVCLVHLRAHPGKPYAALEIETLAEGEGVDAICAIEAAFHNLRGDR